MVKWQTALHTKEKEKSSLDIKCALVGVVVLSCGWIVETETGVVYVPRRVAAMTQSMVHKGQLWRAND